MNTTLLALVVIGCLATRYAAAQLPDLVTQFANLGYKIRFSTAEQTREESGAFENGIWTVRGLVEWLSPDRRSRHKERFVADDKGYRPMVEDEPLDRAGLSPGALASLAG